MITFLGVKTVCLQMSIYVLYLLEKLSHSDPIQSEYLVFTALPLPLPLALNVFCRQVQKCKHTKRTHTLQRKLATKS